MIGFLFLIFPLSAGAVFITASNSSWGTAIFLSSREAADPVEVNISGHYLSSLCPALCQIETIHHDEGSLSTIVPLQAAVAFVHWVCTNNTYSVSSVDVVHITQSCHPAAAFSFPHKKPILLCISSSSSLRIYLFYITIFPNSSAISFESTNSYPQEHLGSYTVLYSSPCSYGVLSEGLVLLTDSSLIFISSDLTFPHHEPLSCSPSQSIVYLGGGELFISCGSAPLVRRYDICSQDTIDFPTLGQVFPFRDWNPIVFIQVPNVTVDYMQGDDAHFTLPVDQQVWFGHGYQWQLQNMLLVILENGTALNLDLQTGSLSRIALPPVNISLPPQLLPSYDATVYVSLLLTDGYYTVVHLGCGIIVQQYSAVPGIITVTDMSSVSCDNPSSSPATSSSTPPSPSPLPRSPSPSPPPGLTELSTKPLSIVATTTLTISPSTNPVPVSPSTTITVVTSVLSAAVLMVLLSLTVLLFVACRKKIQRLYPSSCQDSPSSPGMPAGDSVTVSTVAVQEARDDPHDGCVMGGLPLPPHLLTPGVISEAQPSEERSNQRALLSRHIDNYH